MNIEWSGFAAGPHERCGLLLGSKTPTSIIVRGLQELTNYADDPTQDFAISYADVHGRPYIGIWHTHPLPTHDIGPSSTDIEQMREHPGLVACVINPHHSRVTWFDGSGLLSVVRYDIPEVPGNGYPIVLPFSCRS